MRYDYFTRLTSDEAWALVHKSTVPARLIAQLHTGRVMKSPAGEWRALPRLPTSQEIVTAANELSREITKARQNGDWEHAATQLCIESAHDRFRALMACGELPTAIPPIVTDPKSRSRWKPRRIW
jgi:hypothetical protein